MAFLVPLSSSQHIFGFLSAAMTLKHQLQKAILDDFGQHVFARGFQPEAARDGAFSFRRYGIERDDVIEVQFDKFGAPKFVLNFGSIPSTGLIDSYGRFVKTHDARISHLVNHGRLHRYPHSIIWFKAQDFFGIRSAQQAVAVEIERLVCLFEQVELWFETGGIGSNIKLYKDDWNAPGVRKKSMQARGKWPPEGWTPDDEKSLRL